MFAGACDALCCVAHACHAPFRYNMYPELVPGSCGQGMFSIVRVCDACCFTRIMFIDGMQLYMSVAAPHSLARCHFARQLHARLESHLQRRMQCFHLSLLLLIDIRYK